jgi:hypothetical protein
MDGDLSAPLCSSDSLLRETHAFSDEVCKSVIKQIKDERPQSTAKKQSTSKKQHVFTDVSDIMTLLTYMILLNKANGVKSQP